MPEIAHTAMVSEATAYRYFSDLVSLVAEAYVGLWESPEVALAPVAMLDDPVARVAFATDYLMRVVLSYQGAARAMISGTINKPDAAIKRPGIRFGLIDFALAPLEDSPTVITSDRLGQLKRDLALVMSAEALFILIDSCGLNGDDAVASAIRTAITLTRAAVTSPTD